MSRIRSLFPWLVVLVLPLQGLAAAPQADLAEPLVLIPALASRVPEKPPRA